MSKAASHKSQLLGLFNIQQFPLPPRSIQFYDLNVVENFNGFWQWIDKQVKCNKCQQQSESHLGCMSASGLRCPQRENIGMWYFFSDGTFLQAECWSPCVLYCTNSFSWQFFNRLWLIVKYVPFLISLFLNDTYYSLKMPYCYMMRDCSMFLIVLKLVWNVTTFTT